MKKKQIIKLNESQLKRIIREAYGDYIMANDGGYVTDDGYSLDGLDDARWEREYSQKIAQEWEGFPEDIFNEYDLIPDGMTTPDDVIMDLAGDKFYGHIPWCYDVGLSNLRKNPKYEKYAKSFAQYLLTRGGLSKKAEEDEINRVKSDYLDSRNRVKQILER